MIFSLIISLFGGIFLFIFQKLSKKNWNLTILEFCFISYAVGILIYIQWAYVLNLYKFFNFYSADLPICVGSLLFVIISYKTRRFHFILTKIIRNLRSNRKRILMDILIILIIFIIEFLLFWTKITETEALSSFNDTHRWIKQVLFLNKNGYVNFIEQSMNYPWGFNFILGGNLSLFSDLKTNYFFLKVGRISLFKFLYSSFIFNFQKILQTS